MTSANADLPVPDGPVILFDAQCVLCSANARFILGHDREARFHLASTQGAVGGLLMRRHGLDPADPATMIVVEGKTARRNSDAVLHIYETLGYPWRLAGIARLVPRPLRDRLYTLIARNRYRLFGRRQTCWVAPPEYSARIL